jgi:hypothetical protein
MSENTLKSTVVPHAVSCQLYILAICIHIPMYRPIYRARPQISHKMALLKNSVWNIYILYKIFYLL